VYEELLSVKGVVDLPPPRALDSARGFLERQGYAVVSRTATTLTAEPRGRDHVVGASGAPRVVVMAVPQPEGGVKMKVRGTDREGVRERQGLWALWAEGLPTRGSVPDSRVTVVAAKKVGGGFSRALRRAIGGLFSRSVLLLVVALPALVRC
jgi:hypothetical protein